MTSPASLDQLKISLRMSWDNPVGWPMSAGSHFAHPSFFLFIVRDSRS